MLGLLSIIAAVLVLPVFLKTGDVRWLLGLVGLSCLAGAVCLLRNKGKCVLALAGIITAIGSFLFLFVMAFLGTSWF
jgi:hypothetical protein